ncbi:MAG: putative porin [Bdellovibrionales bacterium]|nr:putative porin [Bdellovibrionales bacterium]
MTHRHRIAAILALAVASAAGAEALAAEAAEAGGPVFSGRVRYRAETISESEAAKTDRRHRIAAQAAWTVKPAEDWEAAFGLGTGGGDPVSYNSTLTGSGSRKGVGIDLAFVRWNFADDGALTLGKQPLPFSRPAGSDLVYDGDYVPEGITIAKSFGEGWKLKPVLAGHWLADRNGGEPDSIQFVARLEAKGEISEGSKLDAGLGYIITQHTEGRTLAGIDLEGNAADAGGNYATGFGCLVAGLEYSMTVADKPLRLGGEFVTNGEADDDNTGFLAGIGWGGSSKPGDFGLKYNFRRLEANATLGGLADSDAMGGGTDVVGHMFAAEVGLAQNVKLDAKAITGAQGVDADAEYFRTQLDLTLKF